jgi:ferredoxin
MPKLTVSGRTADVADGRRLVLAIEELGIEIGHRCGGKARCTTCRVTFSEGEPEAMTRAEHDKLAEKGLLGDYRLSCQILCDRDMELVPANTLQSEGWTDTGPALSEAIVPEPDWSTVEELSG